MAKKEIYRESPIYFSLIIGFFLFLFGISLSTEKIIISEILDRSLVLVLGTTIFIYFFYFESTFEIAPTGEILNKVFTRASRDKFSISQILYVFRARINTRFLGRAMIFYYMDKDGYVNHSSLPEANFSDSTLKAILVRVTQQNKKIDISEDYKELLQNDFLERGVARWATEDYFTDIEKRLKAQGLQLKPISFWQKINGY